MIDEQLEVGGAYRPGLEREDVRHAGQRDRGVEGRTDLGRKHQLADVEVVELRNLESGRRRRPYL